MADRVNTKFVVTLVVVLVALVAGFGGLTIMALQPGPERMVEQADAYLEQGRVLAALERYGRAIKKRPTDERLLVKYLHALDQKPIDNVRTAYEDYRFMRSTIERLVSLDPSNQDHFERAVQFYLTLGEELGAGWVWDSVVDLSAKALSNNPDWVLARKYQGMGQVNRANRLDITTEDWHGAKEDLQAALDQFPDDRDLLYYLAKWNLREAALLDQPGRDPAQAQQCRQEADRLSAHSLQADAQSAQRWLDRIEVLQRLEQGDDDEATQLLAKTEQWILENPTCSPSLVNRCIAFLQFMDRQPVELEGQPIKITSGMKRMEDLLRAVLQSRPDDLQMKLVLGRLLEVEGRLDEAAAEFKQAYEMPISTNVINALKLDRRGVAGTQYASILLTQAAKLDKASQEELFEEAGELLQKIAADYTEFAQRGSVNLELGRLAAMREQWSEAADRLEQANAQFNQGNIEALKWSALVWKQRGQVGTAIERLERLLEIAPNRYSARNELVQMYMSVGDLDRAGYHLGLNRKALPEHEPTKWLYAKWLAATKEYQQAIDVIEDSAADYTAEQRRFLAKLYSDAGQPDIAHQMLEAQFHQDPTNLPVLAQLFASSSDPQQKQGYLDLAREAGVDPTRLDLVERRLRGDGEDQSQLLEAFIDEHEADPVRRHLARYQLYRLRGDEDQAQAQLDQAVELGPESPQVIQTLFSHALSKKDWKLAKRVGNQAAELDLDEADGAFFFGRLAVAQGEFDQAAEYIRRGLKLKPIYSEGWWMLGDVLKRQGILDESVSALNRALDQKPNNVRALKLLAQVYVAQHLEEQALDVYRKAVGFAPRSRSLREEYLRLEEASGDAEQALANRQERAKSTPQDFINRSRLALLLGRMNRINEAQAVIDQLLKDGHKHQFVMLAAAEVRKMAGDADGGRRIIQDYVHHRGDQATEDDWMMLARYLMGVRQIEQGLAAYRQAIELENPEVRSSTRALADLLFLRGRFEDAIPYYQSVWEIASDEKRVGQRYVEALVRADRIQEAQQVMQVVIGAHGRDEHTWTLEAEIAAKRGDMDQALAALAEAEKIQPRWPILYFKRAEIQMADPEQETAVVEDLSKALQLDSGLRRARMMLAAVYARRGDTDRASSEMRTLIEQEPFDKLVRIQLIDLYRRSGQRKQRMKLLRESTALFPNDPTWLRMQADLAIELEEYGLAVKTLRRAVALEASPFNLIKLVNALINANQPQEVLSLMRQHSQAVSQTPILQSLRGRALAMDNDEVAAAKAFALAIEMCKFFDEIPVVRLQIMRAWGGDKAIAFLLDLASEQPSELLELAIADFYYQNGQAQRGLDRLEEASVDRFSNQSPYRTDRDRLKALILHELAMYDEAERVYHEAIEAAPEDYMMLNNFAYLLSENLNRPGEAVPLARRAAKLAPQNALVLDTLGWSLFKSGQVVSALGIIERSVITEASPVNCYHLGEIYIDRGQYRGAVEAFDRAKALAEEAGDQKILSAIQKRLEEINQSTSEGVQ